MAIDKKEVARILKEIALLSEIHGENVFKVRAYQNAARVIEGLSQPLAELVSSGELINLKGVGKAIAEKVETLFRKGRIPLHDELLQQTPAGVMEMTRIAGLGPKKIRAVWQEMGITTVEDLERACREDRLAGMKGFGSKTQEKILQNIELLKTFHGRFLLSEAYQQADQLLEFMRACPGVIRCEVAGSLRRSMETVKDIDLVAGAAAGHRAAIMEHFTRFPGLRSITNRGETKSTIILQNGQSADLRIVSDDQYPSLLHHSTGSKEHNVALRQHARKMGMKVSEYGLYHGEKALPCRNEAELFGHLGLAFIPPELRENLGEIEAAQGGELPKLVEAGDIRGIIHTHSLWSDGLNSIEEMVERCRELGYSYLAVSDHSQAAAYANGLNPERVSRQHAEIDALNSRYKDFRILKSIECDILSDGRLDFDDEVLAGFELVIISVHSQFNMSEAQATERIIRALQNPFVTILGHPTGRLLLKREGYPLNQEAVIEAAAELGVSIEINANPRRLDLDWRLCRSAAEKGVMISINPDAHHLEGLNDMRYGIGIARKGWLRKEEVLNTRSAEEVLEFARCRREQKSKH